MDNITINQNTVVAPTVVWLIPCIPETPIQDSNTPTLFNCTDKVTPYKCKKCSSFRTDFLAQLQDHILRGHPHHPSPELVTLHKCSHCNFETFSKYLLLRHISLQCQKQWLKCIRCPFKTRNQNELAKHAFNAHIKCIKKYFQCEQCSARFVDQDNLERHINVQHVKDEFVFFMCGVCTFKSTCNKKLQQHVLRKHKLEDQNEWFECEQCPSKFRRKKYLKRHVKLQHGNRKEGAKCKKCSRVFKNDFQLEIHMACHHKLGRECT